MSNNTIPVPWGWQPYKQGKKQSKIRGTQAYSNAMKGKLTKDEIEKYLSGGEKMSRIFDKGKQAWIVTKNAEGGILDKAKRGYRGLLGKGEEYKAENLALKDKLSDLGRVDMTNKALNMFEPIFDAGKGKRDTMKKARKGMEEQTNFYRGIGSEHGSAFSPGEEEQLKIQDEVYKILKESIAERERVKAGEKVDWGDVKHIPKEIFDSVARGISKWFKRNVKNLSDSAVELLMGRKKNEAENEAEMMRKRAEIDKQKKEMYKKIYGEERLEY